MKEALGFIGLGIMGRPMALNLLKSGHEMAVFARRPEALKPLADAGATAYGSPREVAEHSRIVFTMVSDTSDAEAVIVGQSGIVEGAKPGSIVVDMSTISPTRTREIADKLRKVDVAMLDAPVSGGEQGAIDGTLSIMVGGEPAVFERALPLLQCMGKNIVHIGANGAGQVAKTCNQIVVGQTIAAVGEALLLAQAAGVDPAKVREALLGGFAYSKILEVHGQRILDRNYRPGFTASLHHKDMRIAMETAQALGIGLPGAALITQYLNALVGSGGGDMDSAAIATIVQRLSEQPGGAV